MCPRSMTFSTSPTSGASRMPSSRAAAAPWWLPSAASSVRPAASGKLVGPASIGRLTPRHSLTATSSPRRSSLASRERSARGTSTTAVASAVVSARTSTMRPVSTGSSVASSVAQRRTRATCATGPEERSMTPRSGNPLRATPSGLINRKLRKRRRTVAEAGAPRPVPLRQRSRKARGKTRAGERAPAVRKSSLP